MGMQDIFLKSPDLSAQKTVLITGGTSVIGTALIKFFIEKNTKILFTYNSSEEKAKKLLNICKNKSVHSYKVDFLDNESTSNWINSVLSTVENIDILINNASIFKKTDILLNDDDTIDDIFKINTITPVFIIKKLIKKLKQSKNANIINISDISANWGWAEYSSYVASKSALNAITRSLSVELAPLSIRVNAIAPGIVSFGEDFCELKKNRLINKIPIKRNITPEEIAQAVHFIIENEAINGQIISVDGGRSVSI